jgi:hypothetical protein
VLLSSPSTIQPNRLPPRGTPVLMEERDPPDLDRVRETLREHDERSEQDEPPAEPPARDEPPPEEDGEQG